MKVSCKILGLILFVSACSSDLIKNSSSGEGDQIPNINYKRAAQEKFINGSILESKGEIEQAILEYLEASKLDPQSGIFYSLAKNYYKINKLSLALQNSRKSVQLEPENLDYLSLHASIYSSSRLEDSSKLVYEKILSIDSTNIAAYYQLGMLNEKSRPSYAISLYKKIIDIIGPEWNVLVRIIDLNERLGNVEETIKTFEELLNMNPSDLRLQKVIIESYMKLKKYDLARKLVDEALISFPNDASLLEMKAASFAEEENWKEAFQEYQLLVKNDDLTFENKIRIGSLFLTAVEKDSINLIHAKNIFEEVSKDSSDWQLNAYLGEIELRLKNDSLAIKYFSNAVRLAEWNNQLWIRLGSILYESGKYDLVLDILKKGTEIFPNDFVINLIFGLSLSQKNNHLGAKEFLTKAVKINSSDLTVLTALGFTLNQLKESDEALKFLGKALEISPSDVQVIGMTALIYDSKENYKSSDSLYSEALKIDPENSLILNNFAYSLADRGLQLEEAFKMIKKANEKEPNNSSYLDTMGWIYFRMGEFEKAKELIEKSIQKEPDNSTVIDHLGDVFYKLGNKKRAMEFWTKALQIEPDNNKLKQKIDKGEL